MSHETLQVLWAWPCPVLVPRKAGVWGHKALGKPAPPFLVKPWVDWNVPNTVTKTGTQGASDLGLHPGFISSPNSPPLELRMPSCVSWAKWPGQP